MLIYIFIELFVLVRVRGARTCAVHGRCAVSSAADREIGESTHLRRLRATRIIECITCINDRVTSGSRVNIYLHLRKLRIKWKGRIRGSRERQRGETPSGAASGAGKLKPFYDCCPPSLSLSFSRTPRVARESSGGGGER